MRVNEIDRDILAGWNLCQAEAEEVIFEGGFESAGKFGAANQQFVGHGYIGQEQVKPHPADDVFGSHEL